VFSLNPKNYLKCETRVPERSLGEPLGEARRSRRVVQSVDRPLSPLLGRIQLPSIFTLSISNEEVQFFNLNNDSRNFHLCICTGWRFVGA
jgi:hypothetical protein